MSASIALASPPPVDPEPAYITASAASQIVTSDHQTRSEDWFEASEDRLDSDIAIVSPASLALVNAFLDQLLFNFLASARSTSIASLRPAVSEVLKRRLAKDAINGADEELHEFLGGIDEEELSAFHNGLEPSRAWDLNLVWRRTRLRCMVYTHLGDMEEEDEESFVQRERLEKVNENVRRISRDLGIVSPAAAIFLTSIIEFVGEQALMIAGEAAYTRAEAKQMRTAKDAVSSENRQRVVVEESDMEKIAFNTTLGRLWRSWKKRVRSPSMLSARTMSRDFTRMRGFSGSTSNPTSTHASVTEADESAFRPSVAEVIAKASQCRSPSSDRIESDVADAAASQPTIKNTSLEYRPELGFSDRRPSSMVFYPPRDENKSFNSSDNFMQRRRSSSLPALQPGPYVSPLNDVFRTPKEAPDSNNSSLQNVREQEKPLPAAPTSSEPSIPGGIEAVYGGALHPANDQYSNRTLGQVDTENGMSKEEFDRQMLDLMREMKPQSTSELEESERQLSEASSRAGIRQAQNAFTHFGGRGDQEAIARPASQGVDRRTIEYWRSTRDASETSALPREDTHDQDLRVAKEGPMQGGRPRAASGETDDSDYGRGWERQAPYSYHGPPVSCSTHGTATTSQSEKKLPTGKSVSPPGANAVGIPETDNGAPPLTPLRELMEAAHDTSDEASSLAPSQDASRSDYIPSDRYHNADVLSSGSFLSRAKPQAKPASQLSDLRSQLSTVNTGRDRAAVQRVMPSPVSTREPLTPVGRTSTSSNRDLKPTQTSSSGTSQVSQKLKGLVGRDSSDARRSGTSRRSSEGSGSMTSDKRSLRTPKAEDAQRSFDQLIQSDETIQYTLTPQNMREMDAPDSPRWNHKRTDTAEMADFLRRTGPQDLESTRPVSSRSKVSFKDLNGVRSNPTSSAKHPELSSVAPPISQPAPVQAKIPSRPSTSNSQAGVARDARTKDESVKEFADFLRSTGPTPGALSPQKPGPPIAEPRPIKALPATSPRPPSQQGPSKKITKPNPNSANQTAGDYQSEPATSKRPPKLQAREATVSSDSTSDLADFIRQGPAHRSEGRMRVPRAGNLLRPMADTNGVQRITIADPPRQIPDANGIQKLINANVKDVDNSRASVASTQVSSAPSKSVHSVNSRTGLLEPSDIQSDNIQRPSGPNEKRPPRQDDPPHPIRKQRRIRDPYALDSDSEDENAYRTQPQRQEESLIEFLNSVTPPPSPPVSKSTPIDSPQMTKVSSSQKHRYPSMRDRLTRNGVSDGNAKTRTSPPEQSTMGVPSISHDKSETQQTASSVARGKAPMVQSTPVNRGRPQKADSDSASRIKSQAPQLPLLNPRETSPHLISQVGTKYDTYRITSPTYAAHVNRDRKVPRRPTAQQQPRGEREPGSDVGDLADFLMNSGPPTNIAPPRPISPVKEKEKEGGFGRMFSRRKKSIH